MAFIILLSTSCKAEPTVINKDENSIIDNTSINEDPISEDANTLANAEERIIENKIVTNTTEEDKPKVIPKPKSEPIATTAMKTVEKVKSEEQNVVHQPTQNIEVVAIKDTQASQFEKSLTDMRDIKESIPLKISHHPWNVLLQKYVTTDGKVDYAGFKKDRVALEAYLKLLNDNIPKDEWSKAETMAFWINAYNAHTIDLIVKNYPLTSITDLDGGDPWKVKRISIGGKMYSLNNIEHDILRPTYKDARIHFAVNCAAKSCPKIYNQAWTESNLEANLEKLTKEFVNNTVENQITANKVNLSKIFEWYKSDFGDLISFLNKFSTIKISPKAVVTFNEYDWKLNGY